jgi:hypothetical protein
MKIKSVRDLMQTLREGPYTSWGSYPKFWLTYDGSTLSYEAVREEIWQIARAVRDAQRPGDWSDPSWRVIGCDVNWESTMYCDHTGDLIPSAYGPVDGDDPETEQSTE